MNWSLILLRSALRTSSHLAPSLAGRVATRLFFTPPPRRASERIAALLGGGQSATVSVRGQKIATWTWGHGPRVLLVHGWGGVGGQLATFVPSLQEHGCSVVAFDAPGHGASDGRESSLVHFTEAMLAVQQSMGPVRAVIAHSLGAAASTLAMTRGFEVNGAVFVAPPSHPSEWAQIFGRRFGVTEASIEYMRAEAERRIGFRWREIDTATLARSLRVPLLIVHDRDDEDVPISQGEELADAWPAAQFVTTIGLGHRRILSDPEVIRQSTAFIAESISEAVTV